MVLLHIFCTCVSIRLQCLRIRFELFKTRLLSYRKPRLKKAVLVFGKFIANILLNVLSVGF